MRGCCYGAGATWWEIFYFISAMNVGFERRCKGIPLIIEKRYSIRTPPPPLRVLTKAVGGLTPRRFDFNEWVTYTVFYIIKVCFCF
jgi:hypothetical protein